MSIEDGGRRLIELGKQLGAAGGLLRLASIEAPRVSVIACDTKATRVIEVNGKRYRARVFYDDGRECLSWYPSDEIKDGER